MDIVTEYKVIVYLAVSKTKVWKITHPIYLSNTNFKSKNVMKKMFLDFCIIQLCGKVMN